MTAYTAPGRFVPGGVNQGNKALIEAIVPTTMANTDTLAIAFPDGVDPSFIPDSVVGYNPAAGPPGTYTAMTLTSFDGAGNLIVTSTGALAAGSKVLVRCAGY